MIRCFAWLLLVTALIFQLGCGSSSHSYQRRLLKEARIWSLEMDKINFTESIEVPESIVSEEVSSDNKENGTFSFKVVTENSNLKDYDEVVLSMRRVESSVLKEFINEKLDQSKLLSQLPFNSSRESSYWLRELKYDYNEAFDVNQMWNREHTRVGVDCPNQLIHRRTNFYEWIFRGKYGDGYGQLSVKLPPNFFTVIKRERKDHSFGFPLKGQDPSINRIMSGKWVLEVKFTKTVIEKDTTPLDNLKLAKRRLLSARRVQTEYDHSSSWEYARTVRRENADRRMQHAIQSQNEYYNPAIVDAVGNSMGYIFGTGSEYKAEQIARKRAGYRNIVYNHEDRLLEAEEEYEEARAKNFMVRVPKTKVFEGIIEILPKTHNVFALSCEQEISAPVPSNFTLLSFRPGAKGWTKVD
jgi:hypothetical protein